MLSWTYPIGFIPYALLALYWVRRSLRVQHGAELVLLSLPVFLALLLALVSGLGHLFHGLAKPFLAGSALCLIAWELLRVFSRSHPASLPWRFRVRWDDWALGIVLLLSTILVGIVAWRYSIFDEVRIQGHIPIVESMLRGNFPPTYIAFPEVGFRYHYGFDMLAALFGLAFHVPGFAGIDAATIFCWIALAANLVLFFAQLGIPRKGYGLAFAFTALSGGMSWWLVRHHDGGIGFLFQLPNWQQMFIYRRAIHPDFIMYFFQHPMGLGVIFFLAVLRAFKEWWEDGEARSFYLGAFLLGVMSLAQVMLFATFLATLGLVFFLRYFWVGVSPLRNTLRGLEALGIALGLAFLLGGFFQFSPGAESQPVHFTWPPGYLRHEFYSGGRPIDWVQSLVWYLSGFGLALVWIPLACIVAFLRRTSLSLFLASFCILSFLIPQFFQYAHSWDIVKWFFAFEFSGRLLVVWAFWPWIYRHPLRQAVAWLIVLFGMVTPLRFLAELSFRSAASFTSAELRIAGDRRPQLGGALGSLVTAMKSSPTYYGMVWSSPGTSLGFAMHTGFPVLQLDYNTIAMPVGRERIAARQAVLQQLTRVPSKDLLEVQKVRWVIFSCREVAGLPPAVREFLDGLEQNPQVENHSQSNSPQDCFRAYWFKP